MYKSRSIEENSIQFIINIFSYTFKNLKSKDYIFQKYIKERIDDAYKN